MKGTYTIKMNMFVAVVEAMYLKQNKRIVVSTAMEGSLQKT